MEHTQEVKLKLTQQELNILHTALCYQRSKIGDLIGQLTGLGLPVDEARRLSNQLAELSSRMCDLMTD